MKIKKKLKILSLKSMISTGISDENVVFDIDE